MKFLLGFITDSNSSNQTKGCYFALLQVAKSFGWSKTNPMNLYIGDIIPLALDRLSCSVSMATDLDLHMHIIEVCICTLKIFSNFPQLIGCQCKSAVNTSIFSSCWLPILRHLMQLISVMTYIVQNKALPSLKEKHDQSKWIPPWY